VRIKVWTASGEKAGIVKVWDGLAWVVRTLKSFKDGTWH
jgi:hypothetical protein